MKKLVLLVVMISLQACTASPTVQHILPEIKIIDKPIPESLLDRCVPNPFMSVSDYLSLSYPQRENVLTDYILDLYKSIADCDSRLSSIKEINDGDKDEGEQKDP